MENAIKFYDHFEYFTAIWYSFWSFGIFFTFLVCSDQEQSGNPAYIYPGWIRSRWQVETIPPDHATRNVRRIVFLLELKKIVGTYNEGAMS
jgi:hypothetical protein